MYNGIQWKSVKITLRYSQRTVDIGQCQQIFFGVSVNFKFSSVTPPSHTLLFWPLISASTFIRYDVFARAGFLFQGIEERTFKS